MGKSKSKISTSSFKVNFHKIKYSDFKYKESSFKDYYRGDIFSIEYDLKYKLIFICGYSCQAVMTIDQKTYKPLSKFIPAE